MRKKIKIGAMTVGGFLLCVAFVGLFIFSKSKGNDMKFSDELKLNAFNEIDSDVSNGILEHKLIDTTNWAMAVIDRTFSENGTEMSGEERRNVELSVRNLLYELFNGNMIQRDENGRMSDLSKAYVANVLSEAVMTNVHGMDTSDILAAGNSMYTKVLDITETIETVKKNEESLCNLAWDINDLMVLLSGDTASGIDEKEIAKKLRAYQTNLLTLAYEKNTADGRDGFDGVDGMNGMDGYNGTAGLNGIDGYNGTAGVNGTNGSNGTAGMNGSNGSNGTSGKNGTNGADGSNGKSGSDGRNGANGQNGSNGKNGKDGKTGSNGTNGINGKDGTAGTNGTNGTKGTNGTNGTNGKNGSDGTNGTNGTNGVDGKNGTVDTKKIKILQDTVDDLSKVQVEIISDMKAAMTTIDTLTNSVAVGEKSDKTIKNEVSEINKNLEKAESDITETGIKLASLEKNIKEDYEKKIDSESKNIIAKIDKLISGASADISSNKESIKKNQTDISDTNSELQKYKTTVSTEFSNVDGVIQDLSKEISDTKTAMTDANDRLREELTNADEELRSAVNRDVSDLKERLQGELSETNSEVSVLKDSVRDYMMSSEGHAKVDVLSNIRILKPDDDGGDSDANVFYWERSGEEFRAVIDSPYFEKCMSVQVYYRYRENISPSYEVDEIQGKFTIRIAESDFDRIDVIEIQSILIIHTADESTIKGYEPEDKTDEETAGPEGLEETEGPETSEETAEEPLVDTDGQETDSEGSVADQNVNSSDVAEPDTCGDQIMCDQITFDADGIGHESGDNIIIGQD